MNKWILMAYIVFFYCLPLCGQSADYEYRKTIEGMDSGWCLLPLPIDLYPEIKQDFSDLRVFGYENKDTVEVPYVLKMMKEQKVVNEVEFELLNQSKTSQGQIMVFELPEKVDVNALFLSFEQSNFDWRVRLSGSHDLENWLPILQDFRIVSIKNNYTHYTFTDLYFPRSRYPYYQLYVLTDEEVTLASAKMKHQVSSSPERIDLEGLSRTQRENKKTKETEIYLKWPKTVEVAELLVNVAENFDFYRSIQIEMPFDSSSTAEGWLVHYKPVLKSTISSLERGRFDFDPIRTDKLRLRIKNHDNAPLHIQDIQAATFRRYLMMRIPKPMDYFLYYGYPRANAPQYDLPHFIDPQQFDSKDFNKVALGEKKVLTKKEVLEVENKAEDWWLWLLLAGVMLLMGFYAVKLLRE